MRRKFIEVEQARTHLSRLIARVQRGERIVISQAGKPVAELRPLRRVRERSAPPDDPLLQVSEYGYDGPIGPTANRYLDDTIYLA
jgi:prevent-host-death family protein